MRTESQVRTSEKYVPSRRNIMLEHLTTSFTEFMGSCLIFENQSQQKGSFSSVSQDLINICISHISNRERSFRN